ncbi:MAG TPA: AraC family transcriptional regulator [Flavisolibacter sp.]|nr:AraC family transcriptional regulator [Flavisolibacter sp.]
MKSSILLKATGSGQELPAAPDDGVALGSYDLWKGIKIEHHILPPMQLPQHIINEHRLLVNIGQAVNFEWKVDGKWKKKIYRTGDFALQKHGNINEPRWDREFSFIAIALDPGFVNEQVDIDNFSFAEQRGEQDLFLSDLSHRFLAELRQGSLAGKIYGESLAVAYAIHLASNYKESGRKVFAPKGRLSAQQLKQVIDYSNAFIHQNVGLNELSAQANLSAFHFTRLFKSTVGIAPHQFVLQLKLERSKQLIRSGKMSLTEIAYELGFNDQAHFSNAFKKSLGISPRQFLKT